MLSAAESRLALVDKGGNRLLVSERARGPHHIFRLLVEGRQEIGGCCLVEIVLHSVERKSRASSQRRRQGEGGLAKLCVRHDAVDQAERFAAARAEPFRGKQQFARPRRSCEFRQQPGYSII